MSDEQGYNGWTNYETWAVALWIDNEQSTQEWALELAREAKGNDHERYELAQGLKSELEEAMPDLGGSVWSDLLGAAWSEVDWYEIADHYLQQVEEEAS